MTTPDREDIHLISRHVQWPASSAQKALEDHVHPDKKAWQQFLELLLVGLGAAFTVAGIVFFFAYNWDSLHKYVKIGLIEGLLIVATLVVMLSKFNQTIRQIVLTGAAALVGVLFAVFGQVYQTWADAYDLFLGWTMAITVWTLIAQFAPLWLLYVTLINTTVFLYASQVANNWPMMSPYMLLFFINSGFVLVGLLLERFKPSIKPADWLLTVVSLGAIAMATIGLIIGNTFSKKSPDFYGLLVGAVLLYGAALFYGFRHRKLFYLAALPFSAIIVVAAFILIEFSNEAALLLICLFVIVCTTLLIRWLIGFKKSIAHEKAA